MKTIGYTKPTRSRSPLVKNWLTFFTKRFLLFFYLSGLSHAQTTICSWEFVNSTVSPSIGNGTASIYGNLNESFPTSDYGKCWQLTNFANQSVGSGTRGVIFASSTVGYTDIKVDFMQRSSGPASRWTQLDYSLDGINWIVGFWNNTGAILPKDSWYHLVWIYLR